MSSVTPSIPAPHPGTLHLAVRHGPSSSVIGDREQQLSTSTLSFSLSLALPPSPHPPPNLSLLGIRCWLQRFCFIIIIIIIIIIFFFLFSFFKKSGKTFPSSFRTLVSASPIVLKRITDDRCQRLTRPLPVRRSLSPPPSAPTVAISAPTALSQCPHRQGGSGYLVTPDEHLLDYLPPHLLQLSART